MNHCLPAGIPLQPDVVIFSESSDIVSLDQAVIQNNALD